MEDFNSYVNNAKNNKTKVPNGMDKNLYNLVSSLAGKFDGKSQNDLIKAIYQEAKKGKEQGTLSNTDIDNFVSMLSPMLDDKKRKMLLKIADELNISFNTVLTHRKNITSKLGIKSASGLSVYALMNGLI